MTLIAARTPTREAIDTFVPSNTESKSFLAKSIVAGVEVGAGDLPQGPPSSLKRRRTNDTAETYCGSGSEASDSDHMQMAPSSFWEPEAELSSFLCNIETVGQLDPEVDHWVQESLPRPAVGHGMESMAHQHSSFVDQRTYSSLPYTTGTPLMQPQLFWGDNQQPALQLTEYNEPTPMTLSDITPAHHHLSNMTQSVSFDPTTQKTSMSLSRSKTSTPTKKRPTRRSPTSSNRQKSKALKTKAAAQICTCEHQEIPKRKINVEDPSNKEFTSRYRGVCWYKRTGKWVVQIKINGKRKHIGYFTNEQEAAKAYDEALHDLLISQRKEMEIFKKKRIKFRTPRRREFNQCPIHSAQDNEQSSSTV